MSNLNSLCKATKAFLVFFLSIKTEILISDVEITWILIFLLASDWNILKVTPGVTFRMFQTLANKKINIQVISTSEIKISVLIDKKNTKKALVALHKEFKLDNKKWA